MITRFNRYENKLNEETTPSWFEEKIVKPTGEFLNNYGKPLLSIPSSADDKEIDESLKKLYNTPIANMPVYVYAQLMDIMDEDQANALVLKSPLTKDSSMIEVANTYYILSIANILDSVNKVNVDFNSQGLDQETINILKSNPITIGTIIKNSLVNWYISKEPTQKLVESLSSAVIQPKETSGTVTETLEIINESKGDLRWLKGFFKGGEEIGSVVKSTDDLARLSTFSKPTSTNSMKTISVEYKAASSTDDALKTIQQKTDDASELLNKASQETQEAVGQATTNLKQKADSIQTPKPDVAPDPKVTTKTTNINATTDVSTDTSKKDEIKSFWERFQEAMKNRKNKPKKDKLDVGDKSRFSLKKFWKNTWKGVVDVFTLGGFLLKIPAAAWGIAKYAGYAYGIYWIAKWFEKSDSDSAKKPAREVMSVFEKVLATQKYEPFATFDEMGERFKESLASQEITDKIKAWCTSLNNAKIMSDSDFQKCIDQLESEAFPYYIKASSTASQEFVTSMEQQWENNDELPSLGLITMGLASAYSSVFNKFEDEFYKGEIPLTADQKNLDKPVGLTSRKDISGQERKYMQMGDTGEDIKLLQMSLKKLGIYTGEADGQYDEEMAKIITAIQTNAKPTDTQIEINGKADLPTLNYIAKQITFLSGVVKSSIEGTVSPEEYQKRQQTQGYIQRMQSALADR
jgi:peptidoglycan hydrolase-like protein with peptidoglycan-binding domain